MRKYLSVQPIYLPKTNNLNNLLTKGPSNWLSSYTCTIYTNIVTQFFVCLLTWLWYKYLNQFYTLKRKLIFLSIGLLFAVNIIFSLCISASLPLFYCVFSKTQSLILYLNICHLHLFIVKIPNHRIFNFFANLVIWHTKSFFSSVCTIKEPAHIYSDKNLFWKEFQNEWTSL